MAQPRRSRPDRWCEVDVAPSAPNSRPQVVHTRWRILRRKIASHAVYPHRHQNADAAPGHGVGGVVADGSMTGDDEALAAPLSVLGLTIRASNALLNNGCNTLGDVVAKTERELLWQLPGVGQGTLTEIKAKLGTRGLALRPGSLRPYKRK